MTSSVCSAKILSGFTPLCFVFFYSYYYLETSQPERNAGNDNTAHQFWGGKKPLHASVTCENQGVFAWRGGLGEGEGGLGESSI